MAVSFKGAHFPQDIILTCVRWYVAYPLSTRQVEELMRVVRGSRQRQLLISQEAAFHHHKRPVWVSCGDETHSIR